MKYHYFVSLWSLLIIGYLQHIYTQTTIVSAVLHDQSYCLVGTSLITFVHELTHPSFHPGLICAKAICLNRLGIETTRTIEVSGRHGNVFGIFHTLGGQTLALDANRCSAVPALVAPLRRKFGYVPGHFTSRSCGSPERTGEWHKTSSGIDSRPGHPRVYQRREAGINYVSHTCWPSRITWGQFCRSQTELAKLWVQSAQSISIPEYPTSTPCSRNHEGKKV